ncbi:hypothetical protein MD484_g2313, partial [Candolleomyces efflorescens]
MRKKLKLPQEIVDMIVDHTQAPWPHSRTLKALGLVSRAWYKRTRVYLFHELNFSGDSTPIRWTTLRFKPLQDNPSLGYHVKTLNLESMTHQWFNDWPDLIPVLPLLTALTTLRIVSTLMEDIDWELLLPEWRIALYELMQMASPQITSLRLDGIVNIDITQIAHYSHLDNLILQNIVLSSDTSLQDGAPFPLPPLPSSQPSNSRSLRSLHVSACGEALAFLLSARNNGGSLDLSQITKLTLGTFQFDDSGDSEDESDDPFIEMDKPWMSLLDLCSQNIRTYRVIQEVPSICMYISRFHSSVLDLKRFPNLVDFSIALDLTGFAKDDVFPTPQVVAAFDALSKSSHPISLSTIKIEFKIPDAIPSFYPYVCRETFWGKLDEVLARPAFAQLKELCMDFYFGNNFLFDEDWPTTEIVILAKMPLLQQKGIMKLDVE